MEAEGEIFFSDDEDVISQGDGEVSESLRSEAVDKTDANNHEQEKEHQDKVLAIECESFPSKAKHPLSGCFSDGLRCANCVSKLVYTPGCRKTIARLVCHICEFSR